MARKPKNPQMHKPSGRDNFQTPRYAVDLLVPFIPKRIKNIWECACGAGRISNRLMESGYNVVSSDLFPPNRGMESVDFLYAELPIKSHAIVTNPPFSLKKEFYLKCLSHKILFALLIPADYSGWVINAVNKDGCEKIIPTRRIDYITPTGLSGASGHTSYYHSMWLTWGFGLGRTETFVELPIEWKKSRI